MANLLVCPPRSVHIVANFACLLCPSSARPGIQSLNLRKLDFVSQAKQMTRAEGVGIVQLLLVAFFHNRVLDMSGTNRQT